MVLLNILLDHDDGVERPQSWLRGTIVISPTIDESVSLGQLEVHLIGRELTMTSACPNALKHLRSSPPVHPLSFKIPLKTQHINFLSKRQSLPISSIQTEYPNACSFAMFLPAGIPPTMQCFDRETGGYCSVNYTLKASAAVTVLQDDSFGEAGPRTSTVKTHCDLIIVGEALPLPAVTYPISPSPPCYHLKQSMFRDGPVTLMARAMNTNVTKDEYASFAVAFVNKSKQSVDRIKVSLIERIKWSNCESNNACKHPIQADCKTVLQSYTNWFPCGLQVENILSDMLGERHQTTVHVPPLARTTYNGPLIQVTHQIQVELVVDGISYQDYPKLHIPIAVYDPPIAGMCNPMQGECNMATE